jgi:glycolate oxidase FAD binding subunit
MDDKMPLSSPNEKQLPCLKPRTVDEAADILRGAASDGLKLMPRGHGTRGGLGAQGHVLDAVLSTEHINSVITYEPGDLTLTAQCGVGLAHVDEVLAEHGQWLPLQAYRRRGTLGGLLASAADGVLNLGYGRSRDSVLGARVALSGGLTAQARGRVVKNVAGYDIPRLMVGSLGTLGLMVEVSLRVSPRPARQSAVLMGYASVTDALLAARHVHESPDEPVFLDLLCGACEPQLALGFDGSEERVRGSQQRAISVAESAGCTGMLVLEDEDCATLRQRLDDPIAQLLPEAHGDKPAQALMHGAVIRWSSRPSQLDDWLTMSLTTAESMGVSLRANARPGLGIGFLGIADPDEEVLSAAVRALLENSRRTGSAVLLAGPDSLRKTPDDVWGAPPPDIELMRRTQAALDPHRVFACGRFVGGL